MSDDNERKQAQRTFLRERFLRMLSSMTDKPVSVVLCDRSEVTAQFGATDIDLMHFQVSNLQTPIGQLPAALLRSTDVVSLTFQLPAATIYNTV